jgi:hypothetical protein
MDFSVLPGRSGYLCWRVGIVGATRRFIRRPPKPEKKKGRAAVVAMRLPVVESDT